MSGLPFELLLALRYLRPKRTFVSVITLISVMGVALGVAVLLIVISVMSGFDQQLRETILGFNAHLKVIEHGQPLTNYPAVMNTVAANPNVKGVAPFVMGQALLETRPHAGSSLVFAPTIRGIDPASEPRVSSLASSMVAGEFDVSGHGLLIGSTLARNLELTVGDTVDIFSPAELKRIRASRGSEGILPTEYEVRGIFEVGYYEIDASIAPVSIENAQEMYQLGDSVHGLMVMLHDPLQASAVQEQLAASLGRGTG